jgi:hypothetical protein
MKHGFDADHLASIDGLARLQARKGRFALARLSGTLFSSGHGLIVLVAASLLARFEVGQFPRWKVIFSFARQQRINGSRLWRSEIIVRTG